MEVHPTSENTEQKKLNRLRQKATGESYSPARPHVPRGRPDLGRELPRAGAEPPSGLRAVVETVIQLANADADGGWSADRALRTYLASLAPGDLGKVEVLMCAGRSEDGIRERAAALHRDTHAITVDFVAEKCQVLKEYLAEGVLVAADEGIDLDGAWLRRPSAKWVRAAGSDYDSAIEGMRARAAVCHPGRTSTAALRARARGRRGLPPSRTRAPASASGPSPTRWASRGTPGAARTCREPTTARCG